jgi:uncharacterized protein YggE
MRGSLVALLAALAGTAPNVHAAPAAPAAPIRAASTPVQPERTATLDLQVEGEVKTAPDQAAVSFGVQTLGKTAADAMAANRDRMGATIAALKASGVEAKDIQTSALNLNGQYVYEANLPPRLTGFQAVNQVTVIVRDLTRLGATVDAVTGSGANQINGIDFGLSDPRAAEDGARRAAVRTARARAELYAEAAGMKLGRLVNLSETGGYQPSPMRRVGFADAALKAAPSTPVEPGQLAVRIEVSAIYELIR